MTLTFRSKVVKECNHPLLMKYQIEDYNTIIRDICVSIKNDFKPDGGKSLHLYYKEKYDVFDPLIRTALSKAKGMMDSAKETLLLHIETVEGQLKQMEKKLKAIDKDLEKLNKIKSCLIERSKARKAGKKLPKFKTYSGSGIKLQKDGTVTIKRFKSVEQIFENEYLFEILYLTPRIKKLKSRRNVIQSKLHNKNRKLGMLCEKRDSGKYSICFGGKKMFKSQFTKSNLTHDQWLARFRKKRNYGMLLAGRHDFAQGNRMCRYDPKTKTLSIDTHLSKDSQGNPIVIELYNVVFPYGQKEIEKAISASSDTRRAVAWTIYQSGNDFYVTCTIQKANEDPLPVWDGSNGCVGMDINYDNLAVTEVDALGNYVSSFVIPFSLENNSTKENERILSNAVQQVIYYCKFTNKPLVMENIDKLKKDMMYQSSKRNRKVSMFAYDKITSFVERKSETLNVPVRKVNPAYTSQIGKFKYMRMYGLSVHQAAAFAIARRGLNLNDPIPNDMKHMIPEKLAVKNDWTQWSYVLRNTKGLPPHSLYAKDFSYKNYNSITELVPNTVFA